MTEENKYLDTLFQRKFAGFEAQPPASVWENVHQELHGKKGGFSNPINLATLAALVLISGLLGFSIMKDTQLNISEVDPSLLASLQTSTTLARESMMLPPSGSEPQTYQAVATDNDKPSKLHTETTETRPSIQDHLNTHDQHINTSYAPLFAEQMRLAKMKNRRSFALHTGIPAMNMEGISVRDSKYNPRFSWTTDGDRSYKKTATWQFGAFFTPEVSFYSDDSIANQRSYALDFTARWKKNEFFIESGLGVSFSSDEGKYAIDYEQFLGSYDDVYNVTFDTTESGGLVPVYHTNVVNVYDSISRYKLDNTRNQYTYLQLPVYVGFHKQVDRLGWFVKGGPILSVLVNKNIPEPDAGYNRIIGLDQQMATRVSTHWQLAVSAGITYQLSNKVSIAIEPTFRYYLNSQYEQKYINTRHPYSVGLRTGLLFNF